MNILDDYVKANPSIQNAIDLFKGQWSSNVPSTISGQALLFDDIRVSSLINKAGGLHNKKILELGPLEGGHTYMLDKAGAAEITSIESNQRAFVKCLITKEALGYKSKTLLGDFVPYLKEAKENHQMFDFLLASGVLYHMTNPVDVLSDMLAVTRQIGIWTHYYDAETVQSKFKGKFSTNTEFLDYKGVQMEQCRQEYGPSLNWAGFCGGSSQYSYWLTKNSIIDLLEINNFSHEIIQDDLNFKNGPCMHNLC